MYGWTHKSVREPKSRKDTQTPSFSSTLLDEIYRSMDGGDHNSGELNLQQQKTSKKQSISGASLRVKASSAVEDEGMASLRRAFLLQKWMEKKGNAKKATYRTGLPEFDPKPDPLFFSSGSSSSDSSFGWFSEPEVFCESRLQKPSCFGPFNRPKSIKTEKKNRQLEFDYCLNDDHQTDGIDRGVLIKSKARALKIYANLKKVKQPISPGGRLTSFLNTLFANGQVKKVIKKQKDSGFDDKNIERTTHGSTCSSASSFTRSCLSKNSPRTRERLNNGIQRTVRFYPVSVIIDEDCRPCGEKFICDKQEFRKGLPPLMPRRKNDDYNDDDDDGLSESSSDLFELDHLSILKECDELPVYETTHFGRNRAIANELLC